MIASEIPKRNKGFIVFEGLNGAGKSSIIKEVEQRLIKNQIDYLLSREPGGSELGKKLRKILLESENKIPAISELFLFAADRHAHVKEIIQPAIDKKTLVISDRYYYSTAAFQGYGRGLNIEIVNIINKIAINGLKPDLVFFLDVDPETGLSRNKKLNEKDNFEKEDLDFHNKIRKGFLEIANTYQENFFIIDANRSSNEVLSEVLSALSTYLGQKL